jgi:hypothetical protein
MRKSDFEMKNLSTFHLRLFILIFNISIGLLFISFYGKGLISYISAGLILFYILRKKSVQFVEMGIFCYSLISLVGLLFAQIGVETYGNTFGPYYDDSLYYHNSLYISQFSFSGIPPTLFEIIMGIPVYIFETLFAYQLKHIDLLPINWLVSSFNVVLANKIAQNYFNINKYYFVFFFSLLLNFNFIDASSHFYRDPVLILFLLLAFKYALNNKFKLAILFACFVFLIRAANGLLIFYFILCACLIEKYHFKLKAIVSCTLVISLVLLILGNRISSGMIFRGGFEKQDVENTVKLAEQLDKRLDDFESKEGSLSFRYGNVYQKIMYPFIYVFSPFKLQELHKDINVIQADSNNIFGQSMGTYKIFNLEFFLIIGHILFIAYYFPRILYGLYFGFKNKATQKTKAIMYFTVLSVILVSFISMQARHRLCFLVFFPFLLCNFQLNYNKKTGRICTFCSIFLFYILLLFNILN